MSFRIFTSLIPLVFFLAPPTRANFQALCQDHSYVDAHAHVACLGDGKSGCFVGPKMRESYKFKLYPLLFGLTFKELESKGDAFFFESVYQQIDASKCLKAAVMLALDGVYDDQTGLFDPLHTEIMVPNKFVATEVLKYPKLLWGASINPNRKDWLSELRWSHANGAVLVKLIPAVHRFVPNSTKYDSFYNELVRLKMPLLIHLDEEGSFSDSTDTTQFTGTWRIQHALDLGVNVIIAHAASRGSSVVEFLPNSTQRSSVLKPNFEQTLDLMKNPKYLKNLKADISGLPMIKTRTTDLCKIADQAEIFKDRLIWGSDFPLNHWLLSTDWASLVWDVTCGRQDQFRDRGWSKWGPWLAPKDRWFRQIRLQYATGIETEVFLASEKYFKDLGRITETNGMITSVRK